jgi:hypothetical protein
MNPSRNQNQNQKQNQNHQPPNINDIEYRTRQLTTSIITHEAELSRLGNNLAVLSSVLSSQVGYLKTLLVYKATVLLPNQVNDYISLVCSLYAHQGPYPPNMDADNTPPWMIACAVLSDTNPNDRAAYTSIYQYVYGYSPAVFNPSTTA